MTAQRLAAMRAMRALDKPDSAIGRRYGLTRQRVHQILGKRPPTPRRAPPAAPPAPTREEFAAALLAWRRRRGLSQAQAARLLHVTVTSISAWENEVCGCSLAGAVMLLLELMP